MVSAGAKEEDIWYNKCSWRDWTYRKETQEPNSMEVGISIHLSLHICFPRYWKFETLYWLLWWLVRGLDVSRPGEADDSFPSLQVRNDSIFCLELAWKGFLWKIWSLMIYSIYDFLSINFLFSCWSLLSNHFYVDSLWNILLIEINYRPSDLNFSNLLCNGYCDWIYVYIIYLIYYISMIILIPEISLAFDFFLFLICRQKLKI